MIVLKVTEFGEDQLNCFWDIQQKPSREGILLPPSPSPPPLPRSPNRVNLR